MATTGRLLGRFLKRHFIVASCLMGALFSAPASAQVNLGQEPMLMLQASQLVLNQEYGEAENVYSQVLVMNPNNLQAYIQRAIVRREMKNRRGMESDAVEVLNLTNLGLEKDPNNADLYYHRGTAYRLLKDFPKARADIQHALQLNPTDSWRQDLIAIDLEEKMM